MSGKGELHLHRTAAIARGLKGLYRPVKAEDAGKQRLHIDNFPADQINRQAELLVEAEGAADFEFFRHDQVLRNGNVAAEAKLDANPERLLG